MRFVHTADLHFDTALNRLDRLDEQVRQFSYVVSQAIERECDAFLVAGDVFYERTHGTRLSTVISRLAQCLIPLLERGIQVVVLRGNHDQKAHLEMLESMVAMAAAALGDPTRASLLHFVYDPSVIEMPKGVQLVCLPYPTQEWLLQRAATEQIPPAQVSVRRNQMITAGYLDVFRQLLATTDAARPVVVAGHFTVEGARLPSSQSEGFVFDWAKDFVMPKAEFTNPRFSYVALGHIHEMQRFENTGGHVWYCGSPERLNFDEAESTKGFLVVDVERGEGTRVETVEIPASRMATIRCTADALEREIGLWSEIDRRQTYVKFVIERTSTMQARTVASSIKGRFPRCVKIDVEFSDEESQARLAMAVPLPVASVAIEDFAGTARAFAGEVFAQDESKDQLLALLDEGIRFVQAKMAGARADLIATLDFGSPDEEAPSVASTLQTSPVHAPASPVAERTDASFEVIHAGA